jgi:hypothetical protein
MASSRQLGPSPPGTKKKKCDSLAVFWSHSLSRGTQAPSRWRQAGAPGTVTTSTLAKRELELELNSGLASPSHRGTVGNWRLIVEVTRHVMI